MWGSSQGSSGLHIVLLLLLLLLECALVWPAAALGASAVQAAAGSPPAAETPSSLLSIEATAAQQQQQQQQQETDGVEHSAFVAAHDPAAAGAAAAAAAFSADAISSAAESAASAVMAASAGPAASPAQQQQQQQDVAAAAAAADSADKEAAAASVAAAAAAAALSTELLRPALPLGSDAPSAAAAEQQQQQQQQQQQEADPEGRAASLFSSLPDTVASKLKGALRFAAVAAAVLLQLTPLPTVARIVSCKSTLGLQSLPFFTLLFSASLWLLYGILRVDPTLLLPNVSGVVAGGWFVVTFWANAGREDKQRFLLSLYLRAGALILASLLLLCLCCPYAVAELVVGLVASVVNVVSYAAPLAALRAVLKEKSTALMPAEISVGNFICSGLWLAYGWIAQDIFIIIPNFIAVGSSSSSSRKQISGKGLLGAAAAWIRQSEGDGWEETGDSYSSSSSKCNSGYPCRAAAPAAAPAAAAAPSLQASVCVNAPSLPTHDELLKHCGFDADPEELTVGFEEEFLE
ncbi:hypothetical protein Emag_001051 [Eimeria magna]